MSWQSSLSFLDSFLLQSAPKDPPAPRRSTRSHAASEGVESNSSSKKNSTVDSEPVMSGSSSTLVGDSLESAYVPPHGFESPESSSNKQRIRIVRNVGGWISPDFSNDVDRSWLEGYKPMQPFDVRYFVPQIGDTVL